MSAPDKVSIPYWLTPPVTDKASQILHICHMKKSLEAEILLDHQTLFFNKKPHKIKINPPLLTFGKNATKVEVFINKVKVIAIVYMGAPVNIILSNLAKHIKMYPELPFSETYSTAGLSSTTAVGAYFSL